MADISETLGFGLWHLPIVLIAVCRGIASAMLMMIINFAAPKTDFKCSHGVSNATSEESRCWQRGINGTVTKCSSWEYDHTVFSTTMIEEWDLVCDRSWLRSMSQSLYLGGMLFGSLIFPHISDKYGRRITVLLTSVLMLVFGIGCAWSPTLLLYNISRFIIALGTGGIQSAVISLFVETVPSRLRTLLVATYGLGWTAGQLGLVAIAYLIRDWRHLQTAVSLTALPIIVVWWFLPESPRWLLTKDRMADVEKELRRAAAFNRISDHDISAAISSIEKKNECGAAKHTANITDLLRGRKLRTRTLVLWFTFFSHRLLYFHLSFASALFGGDVFVNYAIVQSMELPAKLFSMVAVRFFRRRATLIACFVAGTTSFLLALAFPSQSIVANVATSAFSMLFMSSAMDMMNVYSAEVFPTVVRTVGVGSAYMTSRVGSTVAPFLASIARVTPNGVMQATVGTILFVVAFALFFMPETLHTRLPDTLLDAEQLCRNPESAAVRASTPILEKANGYYPSQGDVQQPCEKNGNADEMALLSRSMRPPLADDTPPKETNASSL